MRLPDRKSLLALPAVLLLCCCTGRADAVDSVEIRNFSDDVVFELRYFNVGDGPFDGDDQPDVVSTFNLSAEQRTAIERGVAYWAERLLPTGTPAEPIIVNVGTTDDVNAYCGMRGLYWDGTLGIWRAGAEQVLIDGHPMIEEAWVSDCHMAMMIGLMDFVYDEFGQTSIGEGIPLEAAVIHEFGHGLGLLQVGDFDNPATRYMQLVTYTDPTEPTAFFIGAGATKIYGDVDLGAGRTPRDVPLNYELTDEGGMIDIGHLYVGNALFTHFLYRNYTGFMEVELAILDDIGYGIDLRNFFGRSIYTDGNTFVNDRGYSNNWDGARYTYDVGDGCNTASYGLGLHVFGSDNHITQTADILTSGHAGMGIRSDGFRNTIVIDPGARVHAIGPRGTGLQIAFGTGTEIIHRGELKTGDDGVAARFDFGSNTSLGNTSDAFLPGEDLYLRSYFPGNGLDPDDPVNNLAVNLDGPLVERFDITGTIIGGTYENGGAAVYVAENAHVREINVMAGASVAGDLVTDYTDAGRGTDRYTVLTFGREAAAGGRATDTGDDAFAFTFADRILGTGNFHLLAYAGATTLEQELFVREKWLLGGAGTFVLPDGVVSDGTISPGLAAADGTGGIGTLSLRGTLSTGGGNTFLVQIRPADAPVPGVDNDLVDVAESAPGAGDGRAVVASGSVTVDVDANSRAPRVGEVYTFLQTIDGLTVAEPVDSVYDNIPFYGFDVDHDDRDMWMGVRKISYAVGADTPNRKNVGVYLDGFDGLLQGGDLYDALVLLENLSAGEPDGRFSEATLRGVDELSGQVYATLGGVALWNATLVDEAVGGYLRNTPDGRGNRRTCGPCEPCSAPPGRDANRHSAWALGFGLGGSARADGNSRGYEQSFGGTVFGVDRLLRPNVRLGFYGSYGEGRFTLAGLDERTKSQEWTLGLYFHKNRRRAYFLAGAALGRNEYKTDRTLGTFREQASSDFGAFTGTAWAEGGLNIRTHAGTLRPYAAIRYVGFRRDSFFETGAGGLCLFGDSGEAHGLRPVLGIRCESREWTVGRGRLGVDLGAAWLHELLDATCTEFTGTHIGTPAADAAFRLDGNDAGRDWAVLGITLNYRRSRLRLFGSYETYVNERLVLHTAGGGFACHW